MKRELIHRGRQQHMEGEQARKVRSGREQRG